MRISLPYIKAYKDRHGVWRYYFRRKFQKPIALPSDPSSKQFHAAYQAALGGETVTFKKADGADFSMSTLIASYKQSPDWLELSEGSRTLYLKCLKPIEVLHGHRSTKDLPPEKAIKLIQEVSARSPSLANVTRAVLKNIFDHAIYLGWRKPGTNPFAGIKRYKTGEHHTWTDEQIAQYIAHWPLGSRERMAFDLYYYTAQRTVDVCKMRRTDIKPSKNGKADTLYVKQQKTGVELLLPVHPGLRKSIHAYGVRGPSFVARTDGKPMALVTFGHFMARAIEEAGLPAECVPHGIRKHVLSAVAERGGTTKQLQALGGHKTLSEIERYTEKADQGRLAIAAVEMLPDLASV